ncbi:hypothetical protein Tco_1422199, partial [Tanacetum coccineum]
ITSTYIHLKLNEFVKYASDLPTLCPRILLSGPAGSEIYQETLTKALAKHFGARLLVVESLLLPSDLINTPALKNTLSSRCCSIILPHVIPGSHVLRLSAAKEVDTTIKESTRPERLRVDDVKKLAINELFKVAVKECKNGSLLLFVKDIEKSMLGNTDAYGSFKSKLESLPGNVVVIASHTQKSQGKSKQ